MARTGGRVLAARMGGAVLALALLGACTAPGASDPGAEAAPLADGPDTDAPDADAPDASTDDPAPGAEPPDAATPGPPPSTEAGCADPLGCYGAPERLGSFDAETLPEASGLAAGIRNPQLLYLLDDRPGTSEIWVAGPDGDLLGALPIDGMDTRDGESLAVGRCGAGLPDACLFIGDIGDNTRSRDDIVVHRVVEPDLSEGHPGGTVPADMARLRYPDGAADAEALLVDDAGRVHLVTKAPFDRESGETGETRLYRAEAFADGVLTDLGPLPVPEPRFPVHSMFVGAVVTGGEHRDGRVLLRTYDSVIEYVAPDGERDLAALAGWAVREVPSPVERQSEALTWAADGCGYLTVGEGSEDIWRVPCVP